VRFGREATLRFGDEMGQWLQNVDGIESVHQKATCHATNSSSTVDGPAPWHASFQHRIASHRTTRIAPAAAATTRKTLLRQRGQKRSTFDNVLETHEPHASALPGFNLH